MLPGRSVKRTYSEDRSRLAGKAEPLITAEEALDTARLIDAAFQSAETGEVVRLGQ